MSAALQSAEALLHEPGAGLDARYRSSPAGQIPEGRGEGLALIATGTAPAVLIAALVRRLAWQGKVFDRQRGELRNLVTPWGLRAIRARVYPGRSRHDGGDSIILDYRDTSFVARWIRDEIRQIAPGVYLGFAYWGPLRFVRFSLSFPDAAKGTVGHGRQGTVADLPSSDDGGGPADRLGSAAAAAGSDHPDRSAADPAGTQPP
jgi:hypothetical protein